MLENIIHTIGNQLEVYIKNKLGTEYESPVLINRLVNDDGSSTLANVNAVVLSLVNVQQENLASRTGSHYASNRPINLNLYILFSACFTSNYIDSFKYLSAVISFFQANPVFNHSNTPDLDSDINKLSFEIENLDTASVSQLWGAIGAKHQPFVLYKVRMITYNESSGGGSPSISGVQS